MAGHGLVENVVGVVDAGGQTACHTRAVNARDISCDYRDISRSWSCAINLHRSGHDHSDIRDTCSICASV